MATNRLQRGDVIDIEKGMGVYATIPERFAYANRAQSMEPTNHTISVGEIRKAASINLNSVAKDIQEKISYHGGILVPLTQITKLLTDAIDTTLPITLDTSEYIGEYVVVNTALTGGGTGMGPHDIYPDGWHVTAKKLKNGEYDNDGLTIEFYQSGCFNAMLPDIKPIRRMQESFKAMPPKENDECA
jgi:hypothetical protein